MGLSDFEGKYVRLIDIYGECFTGRARYENYDFLECEFGGKEDGIFIEDYLFYRSQIAFIGEITPHGTVELWTERLTLRRFRAEDAEPLYRQLGPEKAMAGTLGRDPFATPEAAQETVRRALDRYDDEHFYAWVMDYEDVVIGTIGACGDDAPDRIGVCFLVAGGWRGRGYAAEALREVLAYLTENEGIPCVTAWCGEENAAARRVLEKTGMKKTNAVGEGGRSHYEYRREP